VPNGWNAARWGLRHDQIRPPPRSFPAWPFPHDPAQHGPLHTGGGDVTDRACPFGDPFCACSDGLACHYVDYPNSPAWPAPDAEARRELKRMWREAQEVIDCGRLPR